MSSIIVRFPDGTKEFRFPETMLIVGDVIWHQGQRYRVIYARDDGDRAEVTVEADSSLGDRLHSEEGAIRLEPFLDG